MSESLRRKKIQITNQMTELERKLNVSGILMTQQRQEIVAMKPMDLLEDLKNGTISALEVLHAFQAKALEVTRKINCVTEFIAEAQRYAEKCDELPLIERGPLHGLPISIKESIDVQGMDTTLGLAKRLYNPASSNAVVVEVLIQNGAVPFCKTNVPQTLLTFCCSNPVFGRTKNPYDLTRSPGGSSGGEGALIGAGGSILGVGTDLAGSVRLPAGFCGCVGFKPTSQRFSAKGVRRALEGQRGNESSIGFMGRDVDIVRECLKVISSSEEMRQLDPVVAHLPWNELKYFSKPKLRFGYLESVDMFPATPGVRRAVQISKIALQKAGHEVVPFEITGLLKIFREITKIIAADKGKSIRRLLDGDSIDLTMRLPYIVSNIPISLKPTLKRLLGMLYPGLTNEFIPENPCYTTGDYWRLLYSREKMVDNFMKSIRQQNIDLILCPVYPIPAPQETITTTIFAACIYTTMFNYLDFPSGAVSVTKENENDQILLKNYPETDRLFRIAKQSTKGAVGLPIGVLITGIRWTEELVCRGMLELQEALKTYSDN